MSTNLKVENCINLNKVNDNLFISTYYTILNRYVQLVKENGEWKAQVINDQDYDTPCIVKEFVYKSFDEAVTKLTEKFPRLVGA